MGRKKKQLPEDVIIALRASGKHIKDISADLGVSKTTLSRRIADLKYKKGILTKYRELQGLQLTAHQARILEAVEAKDFESASLTELIKAFDIIKKSEIAIAIQGKDSYKVPGLLRHLEAMEGLE